MGDWNPAPRAHRTLAERTSPRIDAGDHQHRPAILLLKSCGIHKIRKIARLRLASFKDRYRLHLTKLDRFARGD